MRLLFCFILFSSFMHSQVKTNTVQVTNPAFDFEIDMSCGFAAQTSPELKKAKDYVLAKNYKAIKSLLSSKNILNQIIGVLAAEELVKQKLTTLKYSEKKSLAKIKQSKKKFFLCSGSSIHHYGSVSEIFYPNVNAEARVDIAEAIRKQIGLAVN